MHISHPADTDAAPARLAGERRPGAFMEQSLVGFAELDLSGRHLHVNELLCEMTGYSAEELRGMPFWDLTDPRDAPTDQTAWDTALRLGKSSVSERRFRRKDGTTGWARVSLVAVRDATDAPQGGVVFVLDITQHRQADQMLRDSEWKYRVVADNTYDWEFWLDPHGKFVYCSPSCERITGHAPDAFIADMSLMTAIVHPEDRARYMEHACHAVSDGMAGEFCFRIVRPDGGQRWIEHVCQPVRDGGGVFAGRRGSNRDITDRKGREAQLEQIRNQLDDTQQIAHLGSWEYVAATHETVSTDEQKRIFGLTPNQPSPSYEEILNRYILPEDAAELDLCFRNAFRSRTTFEAESRIVRPDGSVRYIYNKAEPYFDESGNLVRYVGVTLDITDRKKAELELLRSNERLELAKQAAEQGIWDWNMVSGGLDWSPEIFTLFGLRPEVHRPSFAAWEAALHPHDRVSARFCIEEAVRDHTLLDSEHRVVHADGQVRWIRVIGRAAYDDVGRPLRMTGICVDVTERHALQEKIRQWTAELENTVAIRTAELTNAQTRTSQALERMTASELRFRTIFEQAPLGIAMIDSRTGQIQELNERFAEITGRTRDEMVSIDWMSITHPDDAQADLQNMARLDSGQISGFQMDKRYLRPDGSSIWISMTIAPVAVEAGESPRHLCMIEDITDRKEAEDRIRSITDAAQDAIIMMGPRGTVTYWNPAAESILGYSAEEAIGMSLHEQLAPERYRAAFHAAFSEFSRTGRGNLVGKRVELFARRKDGREIPVSISLTAVMLQGNWHSVGILHDITERLEMEEQIRRWNVELERRVADRTVELAVANAAKSEFLANMSHEIRTPMNGVIGMTRLLLDTLLTSEQRRYAETIRASGESMLTLINDILDLSRIEAGKLQLEMMAFDLHALLDDCAAPLVLRAREKGLDFTWGAAPGIPRRVTGDPGRLRQVLNNLVGNAVKFTDKGRVTVLASLLKETPSDLVIHFAIRDTGIGIAAEKQEAIFRRFSQVDASTTRRFGGTGLGLAIAKELTELMGGEIGVDSELGMGSEFWFTILLRRVHRENSTDAAADEIPVPLPAPITGRQQNRARILVAEDNPVNREVTIGILGRLEIQADAVADGTEVIEALKAVPYDLVLMDVQMPGLDGLEATRVIRNPQSAVMNHQIPVIAVTANAMRGDRERCLVAGMNDYISKPVSPQALAEVLDAWLPSDAQRTRPGGSADAELPGEFAPAGSIFDRAGIVARLMGDEALADQILSRFLESVPSQIESLRKCVETGSLAAAQRQAHGIKGAASNVGGELLRRTAQHIEEAARAGDAAAAGRLLPQLAEQFEQFQKVASPSIRGPQPSVEKPLAVPDTRTPDLAQSAGCSAIAAHQVERIEGYSGREFDMLDFGAIQLDKDGTILKYNAYEGRLSGRDPVRVIGKNFFMEVAPCTNVKEFAGRFRAGVANGDLHETFPYRYLFPDRYIDVEITMISSSDGQGAWIFVEERRSH
jgi:photoactive yellow protein